MKKLIIVIFTFVILSFFFSSPSFAVCIMPPGYDPANDPDINLDLSDWEEIGGLLDQFPFVEHPTDPDAPQLSTLIAGLCDLNITSVNMISGTDRPPAGDIPEDYANLICFNTPAGAPVLVPDSGYNMGGGCEVVVLYATSNGIVLKYTPDDNIVKGYTVYINNFHVDPGLLAYYNQYAWDGSGQAPCLSGGQRIGSSTGETCVAIRDTGTYMDPRWEEWWNQGVCPALPLDLFLKLMELCLGQLPPPEVCLNRPQEMIPCCPIKSDGAPGYLKQLVTALGGKAIDLLNWLGLTSIRFTLFTTSDLYRSDWLPRDADYWLAAHRDRYDPRRRDRRIALPEEEPEENGMWGGVAMRLAPPDYWPLTEWKRYRDERRKWVIPLHEKYGVADWWGDDEGGADKTEAFYALQKGGTVAWQWLINSPGLEERIAALSPSTAFEASPQTPLKSETSATIFPEIYIPEESTQKLSPIFGSQTWGRLAAESTCTGFTPFANYEGGQIDFGIQVCAPDDIPYGDVNIEILLNGAKYEEGRIFGPSNVPKGQCVYAGTPSYWSPIPVPGPGVYNITFVVNLAAPCEKPTLNCTVTVREDGTNESTCGTPPPPPPGGGEFCNPPYPAGYENACSDVGEREIPSGAALELILNQYLEGGVELFPKFPLLETISYRIAGILNDTYQPYKEAGVGGVLNAFLPPGWSGEGLPAPNEYATLDAPAALSTWLDVNITWKCYPPLKEIVVGYRCCNVETGKCEKTVWCEKGTNEGCDAGERCRVDTACCCCGIGPLFKKLWCGKNTVDLTLPIKPPDDQLRIRYVGSQTEALRVTQQWLAPPL